MSKLSVDQTSIKRLFEDKKSDFLIPDYQRPYAWGEEECQTLWEDLFEFAFPGGDSTKFNKDEEYYLGPIVTFKNQDGKLEIIDGQQRLTTLMLLLRAFHARFENVKDEKSIKTCENIGKCIWKTDEIGFPDTSALKINSEVATDNDKEEFLEILRQGSVKNGQKSKYAVIYNFFQEKINDFLNAYPTYFPLFPTRILNNCILLPIEAEDQNTALRIFSTLNDRGMPLSDADIFKAQFYKYFSDKGEKDAFIRRWKDLEAVCDSIFTTASGSPLDELFTRYMYYERAKQGNKNTTTEALRKFYEKDKYILLKSDNTLYNLEDLAQFWSNVNNQNIEIFSDRVLKSLFVLNYAPNGMWTYLTSVYFMQNRDKNGMLEDEPFYNFLNKITAFVWAYAIIRPGVNALRTPAYPEMINIVNKKRVEFNEFKFEYNKVSEAIANYQFSNGRPMTKSMLAWWANNNENQVLLKIDERFEIEHIYARKRQEMENSLNDEKSIDDLGNKALLEKSINIRAADYKFSDKKRYYKGFDTDKGTHKAGTKNMELLNLCDEQEDFTESDIKSRTKKIINGFMSYLQENNLIQDS